jgi:hypothetical protein
MKLDILGLTLAFAVAIVVFPIIYPWYAAAAFLVFLLGLELLLNNSPWKLTGAYSRALGILLAGGWVYLLRECSASFLSTYCSGR